MYILDPNIETHIIVSYRILSIKPVTVGLPDLNRSLETFPFGETLKFYHPTFEH